MAKATVTKAHLDAARAAMAEEDPELAKHPLSGDWLAGYARALADAELRRAEAVNSLEQDYCADPLCPYFGILHYHRM